MAYPTLNSNEIFSALYNQIISVQAFADNIAGTYGELVDMARVDGGLVGDTKVYVSTDCLTSSSWGNDSEAANLLNLKRPPAPATQTITLNQFRQIFVTVDDYLSKRAWGTEGAFANFNSVIRGWVGDTKRVYDATTYNTYIGTTKSSTGKQTVEIDVTTATTGITGEAKARITGQVIAQGIADLMTDLKDINRSYNDNQFLRSYNLNDLIFVWNSAKANEIEKRDLPTIYHKDIVDRMGEYVLPARYFGDVVAVGHAAVANGVINASGVYDNTKGTLRSTCEQTITVSGTAHHVFAGDEIPNGATIGTVSSSALATVAVDCYEVNANIVCKVMHKSSVPYMSAFEVGTSFFNPRSLTENQYLTWGHNTLAYLKQYPFVTVKVK